ncbi:AcrR family transcriptional regulator [Bradyrhizobium sp. USDA 4524]
MTKLSRMTSPQVTQGSGFDKPVKQRIAEAADQLFRRYGIRIHLLMIAQQAHSNLATVTKYFGHGDRLIGQFVRSLIEESEGYWREVEARHPGDPHAQLRWWLLYEQERMTDPVRPEALLARTTAELLRSPQAAALAEISQYWQKERRRVVGLCDKAGLREPRALGDKLLLLVHGARNERGAYGRHAPSRLLHQTGDDLMVAHGAAPLPPFDWNDLDD